MRTSPQGVSLAWHSTPTAYCAGFGTICHVLGQVKYSPSQEDVQMKQPMQLRRVMRDSIRIYFAPLTGAFKGIRDELKRVDRDIQHQRNSETKAKKDVVH